MMDKVDKDLKKYIEENILPLYNNFDKGHDINHINSVIDRSFSIANGLNLNPNIVYTVACYHDIGIRVERKNHAKHSSVIVAEDKSLCDFFNDAEIKIIAEAVMNHSTSQNIEPRSIYGKVVYDADKDDDVKISIIRTIEYSKVYHPDFTNNEIITNAYEQIKTKFGTDGLVKFYIATEKNKEYLKEMGNLANDKSYFSKYVQDNNLI